MGLGAAELVLAIEEAFDICFPDNRASRIRTVGQVFDCIVEPKGDKIGPEKGTPFRGEFLSTSPRGVPSMRQKRRGHCGVRPERIAYDTSFVRDLRLD